MLAKKFAEHKHKLLFPCFVQPKLNGIRALYWNGRMQSRDGHFWEDNIMSHVTEALHCVPENYILDGELYVHGWSLQQINGQAAVTRKNVGAATRRVEYHVFDMIDAKRTKLRFQERVERLETLKPHLTPSVTLVDTRMVYGLGEAEKHYGEYREQNYEGMMYRQNEVYGLEQFCSNKENRWDVLLKRKDWLDEDCEILGIEQGTGKYCDCVGSLLLRFPENGATFNAGSGLSDSQRLQFMSESPVGRMAKIKYEMLSDGGVPLKPTIEAVL